MSFTAIAPKARHPPSVADETLVERYAKLADETTGMIRRILLKLADEERARSHRPQLRPETIDLHLVRREPGSQPDLIRTYA